MEESKRGRGRPKKHNTIDEYRAARALSTRTWRQRRKGEPKNSSNDSLQIEFDIRAILQQASIEGDTQVTAVDQGIQAEGLEVPAEEERLEVLEEDDAPWIQNNLDEILLTHEPAMPGRTLIRRSTSIVPTSQGPISPPLVILGGRRTLPSGQNSRQFSPSASAEQSDGDYTENGRRRANTSTDMLAERAAEASGESSSRTSPGLVAATDEPEEALVDIATKLGQQLTCFHGCEDHADSSIREEHYEQGADMIGHITLEEFVARHKILPDTLSTPHMLTKDYIHPNSAAEWKHAFLGTTPAQPETPGKICLPCSSSSQQPYPPSLVTYDVDSIMGFAPSLSFAKQGIRFNLTPHIVANLDADIHLTYPVPGEQGRTTRVPLHTIPHYLFGRLVGQEDVALYLFFPRMHERYRANNYLNQETLQRWTDRVFLPAIYSQAAASTTQHYPASHEHSKLASKASHIERHTRKDMVAARQQYIHHFLQPGMLEEVWDIVLNTVEEEDGLRDFQEVQIFFTAKNLKVLSKRPTLQQMWDNYFLRWDQAINTSLLNPDRVWVDIGKETCAQPSFLWYQDPGQQQAETYLWKPCCLEAYWQWSQHGSTPRSSLRNYYHTALLRDAVGMTALTARGSPSRQQGLVYSQFYGSQKEIFDAAKTYPFQDRAIESLALDPKIRASWQKTGGSQNHRTETLEKSYLASKARCTAGISGSLQKSFGTREEHRMTLSLASRVRERLQDSGQWASIHELSAGVEPFWRIPTKAYLGFVQANLNKFATGFEYVRTLGSKEYVSWEHSQIMIMFLRLLKFGHGSGQLNRELALWTDERVHARTGENLFGLGFSSTGVRDGYCWLLPKIDWEQFTFREDLSGRSLFGNVYMAQAFKARWRAVQEAKDDFMKVEMLGKWLKQYGSAPEARRYILWYMKWMCIRNFRKDTFASIESSIRPEFRSHAVLGRYALCKDTLDMIMEENCGSSPPYRIVSGNKMAFKDLDDFINFLWDFDDGRPRKHWEDRSYRALYKRCVQIVDIWGSKEESEDFQDDVKILFPSTTWVAPYPNHTVFWQHTKQHQRMWLSIYNARVHQAAQAGDKLAWKDQFQILNKQKWIIGRGSKAVLEGTLEDPKEAFVTMEHFKERLIHKWQQHERRLAEIE